MVVVDDAHLAGPALPDWLRFAVREKLAVTVVAAVRSGEGEPLPASAFVHLGALGRDAAAELVGPGRVDELYTRSRGHPLFLTELAQQAAGSELPASLVESVSARCDELGPAGLLLRTAAVIGPDLDVDLLAAVLGRTPPSRLLDDAEQAAAKQFLVEADGMFRFRHELVREALAASATAGRAALLHRQADRVLDRRPGVDPLTVAGHARLGGDLALASRALRDASARAAERHDHAAAEALLDDALRLDADPDGWLARARVRTLRGRYRRGTGGRGAGRPGCARRRSRSARGRPTSAATSPEAAQFARGRRARRGRRGDPGPVPGGSAAGPATRRATWLRPSCCSARRSHSLRGRTGSAAAGGSGCCGRTRAGRRRRWHCCARRRAGRSGVEHTSATMHALLFTGHAHALAGASATSGAGRAGPVHRRGGTAAGPALRRARGELHRLGAAQPGRPAGGAGPPPGGAGGRAGPGHRGASPSPRWKTWPGTAWTTGDLDGARARLTEASALLRGNLVFGWRLGSSTSCSPGAWRCWLATASRRWRRPASSSRRRRRWACRGTPASPGCSRTGPATRSAARSTRARWPRTSTCSTAPWPSRRGGGPATWLDDFGQPAWRDASPTGPRGWRGARATIADGLLPRGGPAAGPGQPAPGQLAVSTTISTTSGPPPVAPSIDAATARSAARRAAACPAGSSDRRNGA